MRHSAQADSGKGPTRAVNPRNAILRKTENSGAVHPEGGIDGGSGLSLMEGANCEMAPYFEEFGSQGVYRLNALEGRKGVWLDD